MVVSGGVNIYPAEAEQVLIEHPAVVDVACIGVPHPEMGEQMKALVVPTDPTAPPDPAELLAWCRDRLSHYKRPRTLDYVDDLGRKSDGQDHEAHVSGAVLDRRPLAIGYPTAAAMSLMTDGGADFGTDTMRSSAPAAASESTSRFSAAAPPS